MKVSIPSVVFVAVAASAVVATSCVKDVFLDAMEEPQVVVECVLTDESVQTLHLVYTKGASRVEAPDLPEAEAVLTDLTDGKKVGRFVRASDRSWHLNYTTVPGHRYRLDVSIPGHDPIWAEQTMPRVPEIGVRWKCWESRDGATYTSHNEIVYKFKEDHGYVFSIEAPTDPVWFFGINYTSEGLPGQRTPLICTDYPYADPFNVSEKEYFSTQAGKSWGNDWLSTSMYPDLDGRPLHKQYLRFPVREDLPKTEFLVSGAFCGYISDPWDFVHAKRRPAELHYFAASEDYDKFLRDSYNILEIQASTDLADIFLRENVYSNVDGGAIGLFGAKIERMLEWEGNESWGANGVFLLTPFAFLRKTPDDTGYYDPANHFVYFQSQPSRITGLPFDLYHYEVFYGYQSSPPSWAPELPEEGYIHPVTQHLILKNEAELKAYGLGGGNPIDFSEKVVLLLVHRSQAHMMLPVSISYAQYLGGDIQSRLYQVGDRLPFCHYINSSAITEQNPQEQKMSAFRVAIVVDRSESINPQWYMGFDYTNENTFTVSHTPSDWDFVAKVVEGLSGKSYD